MTHEETTALVRRANASGFDTVAEYAVALEVRVNANPNDYRQAALELNSEIRNSLAWIATGGEPAVALHAMLATADRWRALLEDSPDALSHGEAA